MMRRSADRRALLHRMDRLDHADVGDDIERTGGKLLHQAGRVRHIDEVEIDAGVGEEALLDSDIPRPADGIGGADHAGLDGFGGI